MTHGVFVVQWEAAGSCWAVLPYKDNTNSVLFVDVSMMLYVMYFPVYRSKKDYYNFYKCSQLDPAYIRGLECSLGKLTSFSFLSAQQMVIH